MVNIYHVYEGWECSFDKIEDEADYIINKIKRSIHSQYIENIKYDMDYQNKIRFIDIFLVDNIKPEMFEEILKYLRDNF